MSRLLGRERSLGVETRYHKEDGKLIVESEQDVEPYLERNKREQYDGVNDRGELRKVGSIPLVVASKWLHEEGINVFDPDHMPKVLEKLRSREYAYLRTGKV